MDRSYPEARKHAGRRSREASTVGTASLYAALASMDDGPREELGRLQIRGKPHETRLDRRHFPARLVCGYDLRSCLS